MSIHIRKHTKKLIRFLLGVGLILLVGIACQDPGRQGQGTGGLVINPEGGLQTPKSKADVNLVLVQHGLCKNGDAYWCVVEKGIADAATNFNVNVTLLGPEEFDLDKMVTLIQEAAAAAPDGIGVTLSDPLKLQPSLQNAIAAGIPVIAYDSGNGPRTDKIPYLTFIGADEYSAGYLGGLRLAAQGGTRAVCINHEVGNKTLEERCRGFIKAMESSSIPVEVLGLLGNPTDMFKLIQDYYSTHPDLDIALTLGPVGSEPFYKLIKSAGLKPGEITHGTFDLSPEVVTKIKDSTTQFSVDAQPYLQGYMVVQWLTWIKRYGFSPAEEISATGPSFVDLQNVELVEKLTGKYR